MTAETTPYADLPTIGELDVRHSWGLLPGGLGTIARITPEVTAAASRLVVEGRTIPLNHPIDVFEPPLFGRPRPEHVVTSPGRNEVEEEIRFNPQASSQLDGLAHVRAREHGFYGGITDLDRARAELGVHHWARRGIATRGVLLDIPRSRLRRGEPADPFDGAAIEPDELEAVAREQDVAIREGDILLLRTGWAGAYLAAQSRGDDLPPLQSAWTGLSASSAAAGWLWDRGIAAVGADNPAVEDAPGDPARGSLHRRLLPSLGMPLFELLDLDGLAAACERSGRSEFLLVCVPLHVLGGVSSPSNAMAVL